MKSKQTTGHPRAFVLVLDRGDEVASTLTSFAATHDIAGAHFTAIGACSGATIAYWNAATKEYERIEIAQQVEIVSLIGNLGRGEDGKPRLHAHVSFGRRDGSLIGGHFVEGWVYPTLEVFVNVLDVPLERKTDEETGLQLLALGE